jgi:hypothetical protein
VGMIPLRYNEPERRCSLNSLLRANSKTFVRADRGRSFCLTGDKPFS